MSRPRHSRAEQRAQTREALLDAAAKVFAQRGFHGASVDAIAEEAGYTKGAVYAHFDSKEGLFLALVDDRIARQVEAVEAILDESSSPDEAQRRLAERQRAAIAAAGRDMTARDELAGVINPAWAALMWEAILYAYRSSPALQAQLAEPFHQANAEQTRYLQAIGLADDIEPEMAGIILSAVCDGAVPLLLLEAGATTVERYFEIANEAKRLLLRR
jgi:AcrR family transcriptional regulator